MRVLGLRFRDHVVLDVRSPRVDAPVAAEFLQGALAAIGDAQRVVVDLSDVQFMDSSGLGALVALRKQMGSQGWLAVAGLRPAVATLLRLTRLDRVFPAFASVSDAAAQGAAHGR